MSCLGRVLPYQEVGGGGGGGGGLGPGIEFRGKIWGKVQQVHQIRGKIWGVLLLQDAKLGKNHNFGGIGFISEIQRAKFGVSVTYIFGGKNLGLRHEF